MKSLQINNTSVLPPHLRYFAWMQFTTTDGCLFLSRSLKAILNGQQHTMARFANRNGVEWLHTQGGEPEALTNIDLEGIPVFKHDPELLAENWLYTSEPHRVWNHWIGPNPPFPTEPA